MQRKAYPSDVTDEEWALVAPYLTLMTEDAPQRTRSLREVFNGPRWVVRAGAPWRMLPNDLPPWEIVYQQSQRWLRAGAFESLDSGDLDCGSASRGSARRMASKGRPAAVSCEHRRSPPMSRRLAGHQALVLRLTPFQCALLDARVHSLPINSFARP